MTANPLSSTRYDAMCRTWYEYYSLGPDPMSAAEQNPGTWQLVYQLRPLELIAYWLGIPFRPYHEPYAVIVDADPGAPRFYTAPAVKVAELGRPTLVRGMSLVQRAAGGLAAVDGRLYRASDAVAYAFGTAAVFLRALGRKASDIVSSRRVA